MKKITLLLCISILFLQCEKRSHITPQAEIALETKTHYEHNISGEREFSEVPVLCYHNFTESVNTIITLSHERFEEHIRSLVDSGYDSILPDQLYDYFTAKASLPSKPVMISFDDTRLAQYTVAAPILEKYGFKGVFFVMTVCVNKPGYLSSTMLNDLVKRGHVIGVHTFDHPPVSDIKKEQWYKQLKEPKIFLENAIHNDVNYFAYPYGSWNETCIKQLRKYGYKAAFQLDRKQSATEPLYTIRRLMAEGYWSAKTLHEKIAHTFNRRSVAIK